MQKESFGDKAELSEMFNHWSQWMIGDGQLTINSAKIYASIWRKFSVVAYSAPYQCYSAAKLSSLNVQQLSAVVTEASKGSATSYPKRMAQLVSRVMQHALGEHAAAEALPGLFMDNRKKDPVYTESDHQLVTPPEVESLSLFEESSTKSGGSAWKRIRDRAIAALCLYAGLRLNEIIQLGMQDIKSDADGYSLSIRGQRARTVPMAKTGNPFLSAWLSERMKISEQYAIDHPYVFIGTLSGEPVARLTVYRATKRMLGDSDHGTATAARNTFAARQIANGTDDQIISDWMGYRTDFTITRHKEAFRRKRAPKSLTQAGEKRRPA